MVATALLTWLGSLVFAAFGLFIGYLVPGENVMQFLGPGLALLSFLGGLFVPLQQRLDLPQDIAQLHPDLRHRQGRPRAADRGPGPVVGGCVNIAVWLLVFAGGAAWRMRRDTARV